MIFYSLEFEERGEWLWAFTRTWEKGTFRRVAVTVTDRFAVDATHELSLLGVRKPLLLFLVGRMCWPTLTATIWEVDTVKAVGVPRL